MSVKHPFGSLRSLRAFDERLACQPKLVESLSSAFAQATADNLRLNGERRLVRPRGFEPLAYSFGGRRPYF
jgi:hypothetical protein